MNDNLDQPYVDQDSPCPDSSPDPVQCEGCKRWFDLRFAAQTMDPCLEGWCAECGGRLHEAGPALLDACQKALTWMRLSKERMGIGDKGPLANTIREAERAIARAEGQARLDML